MYIWRVYMFVIGSNENFNDCYQNTFYLLDSELRKVIMFVGMKVNIKKENERRRRREFKMHSGTKKEKR